MAACKDYCGREVTLIVFSSLVSPPKSEIALSIIETGTQFASAALISRISKELNVPPAALFGQDMNQEYFDNLYSSIDALVENKLKLFQDSLSLDIETKLNQKVSIILNNLMNH